MSLVGLSRRELALVSVALLLPLTALAASGFGASVAHNARTGLASLVPGEDEGSFSTGQSARPASADASNSESGRTHGHARLFGRPGGRNSDLVGGASRLTGAEGASGSTGARGESSPESRSEGTSDNGSGTATGDSGSSGAEPSGSGSGDGASTSDASGTRGVEGSATGPGVTATAGGSESGVTLSAKDEDNGIGGGVTVKDQSPDGGISVEVTSDGGSSSGSGARVPSTGVSVP